MSFRKRNVGLSQAGALDTASVNRDSKSAGAPRLGVRPSPLDGRPTTSTGTFSLDAILAGHAGLALGNSLLVEENGTTDYAGALLRFYAAEGIVQGQRVIVVGVSDQWTRELPAVVGPAGVDAENQVSTKAKMKIAWRYEKLGDFDSGMGSSRHRGLAERNPLSDDQKRDESIPFCHSFDLAKRLSIPSQDSIICLPIDPSSRTPPFDSIIQKITAILSTSTPNTVHRIIIPTLLSPAIYPTQASEPQHILGFLHALRGLLRQYHNQLTVMATLPLELYSRSTAVVRWIELLSDGVLELTPFPHQSDDDKPSSAGASSKEEKQQGLVTVHKFPVADDRGGSGAVGGDAGEDLAFTVSRRKFLIQPFNLPPADAEDEAEHVVDSNLKKENLDY